MPTEIFFFFEIHHYRQMLYLNVTVFSVNEIFVVKEMIN